MSLKSHFVSAAGATTPGGETSTWGTTTAFDADKKLAKALLAEHSGALATDVTAVAKSWLVMLTGAALLLWII